MQKIRIRQPMLLRVLRKPLTYAPPCRQFCSHRPNILRPTLRPTIYTQSSIIAGARWKSTTSELLDDVDVVPPPSHLMNDLLDPLTKNALPEHILPATLPPDALGYLNSLGIDNGIGPTSCMQWVLEHVHVYSGTSWGVSILLSALVFRAGMFFIMRSAGDNSARMQSLTRDPEHKALLDRQVQARREGASNDMLLANHREILAARKVSGVSMWKLFLFIPQIPLGFGNFLLMREMAALPVPGLDTAGMLWFQDLTVGDPTHVLPAVASICTYVALKESFQIQGENPMIQGRVKDFMVYGLPLMSFFFMNAQPGAVQLHFAATTFLSMIQGKLFHNPHTRRMLGMHPIPPPLPLSEQMASSPFQWPSSPPTPKTVDTTAKVVDETKPRPARQPKPAPKPVPKQKGRRKL